MNAGYFVKRFPMAVPERIGEYRDVWLHNERYRATRMGSHTYDIEIVKCED